MSLCQDYSAGCARPCAPPRYSIRAEDAYLRRVRHYILCFDRMHPSEPGAEEVSAFVSRLAAGRQAAASTRGQAPAALLSLYREVPDLPIDWVDDVRARKPRKPPVLFTGEGARAVLSRLRGEAWLTAPLLYGSGPRLVGCVRLRVKDLDFARPKKAATRSHDMDPRRRGY